VSRFPTLYGNAFPAAPPSPPRPTKLPTRWRCDRPGMSYGSHDFPGTPGNRNYRVRLNGEPVPTAFDAAAEVFDGQFVDGGWVWDLVPKSGEGGERCEPRRRTGRVEIVPDPFG
jgi:hypothetical protein